VFEDEYKNRTKEIVISAMLEQIGEDIHREGLVDTPKRIRKSWDELYCGYNQDPRDMLTQFSDESYDQMVMLKDIEMYSMCEHHMLPFFGKAHVAYIPNGQILGISKLARLVDIYARRLQIQERIGEQVTTFLMNEVGAVGAACVIEAQHMCMRMRGCSKQNSMMVTSSMKGAFMDNVQTRNEFMSLIK
jgi:GTP cyclohydrolase I